MKFESIEEGTVREIRRVRVLGITLCRLGIASIIAGLVFLFLADWVAVKWIVSGVAGYWSGILLRALGGIWSASQRGSMALAEISRSLEARRDTVVLGGEKPDYSQAAMTLKIPKK